MAEFLLATNTFFEVFGYQVSYLEFLGTVAYFASVVLIARKNMLTWPLGILSVILFMLLFYQFQLYSDTLEQAYYLGASVVGWILWRRKSAANQVPTGFSSLSTMAITATATLFAGIALGSFMSKVHEFFPAVFPLPASAPYLDAVTTVMSFVAMWLLAVRRVESWIYWILVDFAAIYLYFSKGLIFLGLQYVLLLCIAIYGLAFWARERRARI